MSVRGLAFPNDGPAGPVVEYDADGTGLTVEQWMIRGGIATMPLNLEEATKPGSEP